MDNNQLQAVIASVASTIAIYEATGRGLRALGNKISDKISTEVKKQLPAFAQSAMNGRYPLASDVYPRLAALENAVRHIPERIEQRAAAAAAGR